MEHLLSDASFQKTLVNIAEQSGANLDKIREDAASYMKELYTTQQPVVNALSVEATQFLLQRAYDKTIDVNPSELKSLALLMRSHSVAFVMTHKTYIDMMVLALVLGRHGLPIPHIFAGINMSFMGLAQLGRNSGVIFIRRSFKDNPVYKATLRHFIASRVKERAHFMWAIEGTRSRTGKLVWPKMGILKYIVEGEQQAKQPIKYIPVSTVYDLIPDVQEMTLEGRGKDKKKESLMWFVNYLRKMNNNLGKISIRFGPPVEMTAKGLASLPSEEDRTSGGYTLPRFAFELVHGINQITPVTTASLICTTLLSKFALTKPNIERDVLQLMELIENRKPDALVDRGRSINETVQVALNLLIEANLIQRLGEGVRTKYSIVTSNFLPATYYTNMAVHHLYHRAFIELALVKVHQSKDGDRLINFWTEIMTLRDLFKFEFFYSRKDRFSEEIEEDLSFLDSEWQSKISNPNGAILDVLEGQKLLVSHVVLQTYVEAYKVVGRVLLELDPSATTSESSLLNTCLFMGEEMHWQGQIHRVESVSKPFLLNGIRLAKNLNLIPTSSSHKTNLINAFLAQLSEVGERLKFLKEVMLKAKSPVHQTNIIPLERNIVPGSRLSQIASGVIDGEGGKHIGAFFDLDRTLIKGFSAKEFFQTRLMSGKMSRKEIIAQFSGVLVYAMGNRNFAGLASVGAQGVKGLKEKVFIEVGEETYLKHLAKAIYPESRALVNAHLAKGHTVAIISAATPYQVLPLARDLSIEHVICTEMEVVNGVFTGDIAGSACWGDGKAKAAIKLAKDHDLDMSKSYFYTDSVEDLPLLEIVGHPRPLNPDNKLSSLAFQNDWPVYRFTDEERPGLSNMIRTGLAFGSLIPATIAGVISGSLSLSWRGGVNSMVAALGDIGTKLAGIELSIKGEEHLWSHRPAVFISNHQSNADFFITSKLLRKDTVAIAKKELKFTPIGPLFMAAGVIFIDRSNREKAIEAMKPAVDALKNGTSIAIFPEGTRSYDYQLGPFKKGAFHLAMQGKVPIVPIVIKNAHDVMPRGSALLRPTVVEVVVKKPIPTVGWNKQNINKHIEKIRQIFLDELDQVDIIPELDNGVKHLQSKIGGKKS